MASRGRSRRSRGRPVGSNSFQKVALRERTFGSWRELRNELGFHTDDDLAAALINSYRDRALRGFTVRVEERRYGPPAESSTPFHTWPRARPRFEVECSSNENMSVGELESCQAIEEKDCSTEAREDDYFTNQDISGIEPMLNESHDSNDTTLRDKTIQQTLREWYSDDEDDVSDEDIEHLQSEFEGMRMGDDYLLCHDSNFVDEGYQNNTEMMNNVSTNNLSQGANTQLMEESMEWHSLDEQSIRLGYGKGNKVELGKEYFVNFVGDDDINSELGYVKEKKFICDLTSIKELQGLLICQDCKQARQIMKEGFSGSVLELQLTCENGHKAKWASSKRINESYAINLELISAIFLSGNLYVKFSLLAKFLGLAVPSESSFYRYLKLYVIPKVNWWWSMMQDLLLEKFKGKELYLGGDGRNDSPGHCATYCNYTFMDPVSHMIIHQEVIDVRQSELKSPNMEKLGCKNGLEFLKSKEIVVAGFVTDDHNQISAMMAHEDTYKDIEFQKDCWHKSAKITKKFSAAGKEKGNGKLLEWVPAVRNHFWHCSESCGGNLELMKDMWINMLKHMCNLHFNCSHGPLENLERTDWFDAADGDFGVARELVLDKKLLKSFQYYTQFRHTGELEVFHNHLLMYTPKRVFFKYPSYRARSQLAVIDHNHHCQRPMMKNTMGNLVWSRRWSKKAGRWIPMSVKEPKKYEYIPYLIAMILKARKDDTKPIKRTLGLQQDDPRKKASTIAKLPPRPTMDLVKEKLTRFEKHNKMEQ